MNILLMSPQLTVEVEGFPALLAHRVLGLLVHLVDVLAEVGVLLVTYLTLQLKDINVGHTDNEMDISRKQRKDGIHDPFSCFHTLWPSWTSLMCCLRSL